MIYCLLLPPIVRFSSLFTDFIQRRSLFQYVLSPTRNDNILDLVFCNDHFSIFDLSVMAPFNTSDHNSISFKVLSGSNSLFDTNAVPKFNYKKANWGSIHDSLANVNWFNLFSNLPVECLWDCFYTVLINIIDDNVPKFNSMSKSKSRYPKYIMNLQSRKHILWKKWHSSNLESDKCRYLSISKDCRKAIHEFTIKKESALIDSKNMGRFYNFVNRKLSSKSGIGVIRGENNEQIYDPAKQATIFNKYFSASFTHDDGLSQPFPNRVSDDIGLSHIPFSADNVLKKLLKLKPNSAAGPDNLHPSFLKHVGGEIAPFLAYMFEIFFSMGFVPPIWRRAYVKPIFKSGSSSDASNYRPISLTCVCSKIMESIISEHMLVYLLDNNLISEHQHGFLSRRSTCTQLLDSFQDWVVSLGNSKSIDVAYIDFAKAFDSVVYSKLFTKLAGYGIKFELLAWLRVFSTR